MGTGNASKASCARVLVRVATIVSVADLFGDFMMTLKLERGVNF